MLTPQEVSGHAFSKASFGGYNMAMVDEFLDVLTADYTALYKENAVLKSKMKMLVDKVEEYRTTEDAMRRALLSAQKMADEMIQEAERKKSALLAQAEEEARVKMAGLRKELDDEAHRLAVAKDNTADFMTRVKALCGRQLEYLEKFGEIEVPAPPAADPVVSAAQEIETSVEQLEWTVPAHQAPQDKLDVSGLDLDLGPDPGEKAAPGGLYDDILMASRQDPAPMEEQHFNVTLGGPRPQPEPQTVPEDTQPTRRIDFDHLQFGKDYEIK